MKSDHLQETKETLQQAGIPFTDNGHEIIVTRPRYSLKLTNSYTYGLDVEMAASRKICFSANSVDLAGLKALDTLCEVAQLLRPLNPKWCGTQTVLLLGKKPGDLVLSYMLGAHDPKPLEVLDRPQSVNSLHKCKVVHRFAADDNPVEIADCLRTRYGAVQPPASWEDFVDTWNRTHSRTVGLQLNCGPSYIYTGMSVNFQHVGQDLFLETFRPVPWNHFPQLMLLLQTIQETANQMGFKLSTAPPPKMP